MSSGACRALVAVLLTLVATIVSAVPVVAQDSQPVNTSSTATYTVKPAEGTIDVKIVVRMEPTQKWEKNSVWKQLVVEEETRPQASGGFRVAERSRDLPGLYLARNLVTPALAAGKRKGVSVIYTLDALVTRDEDDLLRVPARLDGSYMYFCVTGQDTQTGSVRVVIDDADQWKPTQLGTVLEATSSGFRSTKADESAPNDIFTCFEGVRTGQLEKQQFVGPVGRIVELQAWEEIPNWLSAAAAVAPGVLNDLHDFLGYDIPGEGAVIVRMAPSRDIGGYASAHSTPGVVQLEQNPKSDPMHQLAHAWFGTDNFLDMWLREGMATWTASAMAGEACKPVDDNRFELDLSDEGWLVVQPQASGDVESLIEVQEAAACGIISAVASRMPEDQWHEVIGAMLLGETKYISSAGPEIGTSTAVDWREWLDAVDERGLVPAASDPAYASNRDELDFAQDLLDTFEIPEPIPGFANELEQRSEARAAYHEFLDYIAPLGAPHAVRKDMDDWNFATAMKRIDKSREVFDQLTEADENLPEADLVRIMKPQFEAARNEAELEEVAQLVNTILEETRAIIGPLGDLQNILDPMGWTQPAAIIDALGERRFDDARSAIEPAIDAARAISEANAALPEAGFLEHYRPLYENATTRARLIELTSDASDDARNAKRASDRYDQLVVAAGDWTIPAAVTTPLENGQLQDAVTVMNDALAVIQAATEADKALPVPVIREEVRPQFEAVQTAAEMALLREQVEQRAQDATEVGNALSTLNLLVPDWTIPAVVADPVDRGDFAGAVAAATAARDWVESAYEADQALKEIEAMERTRPEFESAESLDALRAGADRAQQWRNAADLVRLAIDENEKPRDMLTSFGLMGVNVDPLVDEAILLAIEGKPEEAIQKANEAIHTLRGGSGAGSLRLAGIVFFGVAVLGVLGLWVMLRRQAGPSWARSTRPHWVKDDEKGGLFGRGKKKDKKKDKKK